MAGEPSRRVADVLDREKAAGLQELSGYTEFSARVAKVRRDLALRRLVAYGRITQDEADLYAGVPLPDQINQVSGLRKVHGLSLGYRMRHIAQGDQRLHS